MSTKLSHSAISKYQLCPQSYKYHYIDKIRSNVHSGALSFGNALDLALNELLQPSGKDANEIFENNFTFTKINDEDVYLPTYPNLVYANTDFDAELLTEADAVYLREAKLDLSLIPSDVDAESIYNVLKKKKQDSGFDSFTLEEKQAYNLVNWLSMRRKGFLMIAAYQEKVMPKINKVLAVQEWIKLDNQDGDAITGVVDLVAEVKGHGVVILDNKTSAMAYEDDSVVTSPQLSLYVHALSEKYNTRKAGYLVLRKQVKKNRVKICNSCGHNGTGSRAKTCDATIEGKRCGGEWNETIAPEIDIQIIIDEIPEKLEELVINNYDDVNNAIKNEVFTKNFNSCNNTFGGKCPYYGLCYKGSMHGLVDMKKDKK